VKLARELIEKELADLEDDETAQVTIFIAPRLDVHS
jgi:hypothetical protein